MASRRLKFAVLAAVTAFTGVAVVGSPSARSGASSASTLTVGVGAVAPNLDHAPYAGTATNETKIPTTESLLRYKVIPNEWTNAQGIGDVQADLASAWKINDDGSVTLTLTKAKSVFGNTLRPKDVQYSFRRNIAIDPNAQAVASVASINQTNPVTILNTRQVKINVTQPNALTLAALTAWNFEIYDAVEALKHRTDSDPWSNAFFATTIDGFGPYKVESFKPSEELDLVANPDYFRGAPKMSHVIIRAIPDASTRTSLISSGAIDVVTGLTYDQFKSLTTNNAVQTRRGRRDGQDLLGLNHRFAPFKFPGVRRAVSLALDRNAINDAAYAGMASPSLYQMPTSIPRPLPKPTKQDLTAAKALLAKNGYPNGFEFTLAVCSCRPGPWAEQVGIAIQSQLAAVGLKVNLTVVPDSPTYENGVRNTHSYDAFLYTDGVIMMDVAYYVNNWLVDGGPQNYLGHNDRRLNDLVRTMTKLPLGKARTAAAVRVQGLLETTTPWVPLVNQFLPWVFNKNLDLSGLHMYPDHVIHFGELTRAT